MLLDRDRYEAQHWWNMPNIELSLDSGEVETLRDALSHFDNELTEQLKYTRQPKQVSLMLGRIAEILLRLDQLSP